MRLLGLQQQFSAWLKSESPEAAARFGVSAHAGLAVYLNNYRAQLMACLSASFPVLRAWMGEVAFEAAAAKHIDSVPPHSWTLDDYSLGFPETLVMLYPDDSEIPELAGLEVALGVAFVGGDANAVDPVGLGVVDWEAARLQLVPTFRLLAVTSNVAAIWSAIDAGATPPTVARLPDEGFLAIWRDGLTPRFRTVDADEAGLLRQVCEGRSFGVICNALVGRVGEEQGAAVAGALLGRWLGDRLIWKIARDDVSESSELRRLQDI